jgi:hypothetical protein
MATARNEHGILLGVVEAAIDLKFDERIVWPR